MASRIRCVPLSAAVCNGLSPALLYELGTLPKVVTTKRSRIHKRACEILRLEKDESDRVNVAISVCVDVSQNSIRSRSGVDMKGQRGSWANIETSSGGVQLPDGKHHHPMP